ncbi:hypothetical protein ACFRIC_15890 [Streptomyces sp. NPDC056738]|uniref:effector-associated constant component EACC1 n=1 Tax=Streptomyces sp. NPDC056738 TaxID=3345933 RepID=UPI0036BCE478
MRITSEDQSLTEELGDWLRRETGLRGRVRRERSMTPGTLGGLPELVVGAFVSGAAGSLATTLSTSLTNWLRSRRARGATSRRATLTLTTQDGRTLTLDARSPSEPADVERFLRAALGEPPQTPDSTATAPMDGNGSP